MSHRVLGIDEILRDVAAWVVDTHPPTAVSLACCTKSFEEPALSTLWKIQERLPTLVKTLPPDCWEFRPWSPPEEGGEITLTRTVSKDEWARVKRYASWMRSMGPFVGAVSDDMFQQLSVATSGGPVCPQVQNLFWSSQCGWKHTQQFLSPHLVSVIFYQWTCDVHFDPLTAIIPHLPTTHLEEFFLTGSLPLASPIPIRSALSEVIQRFNPCFKLLNARSSISNAAWGYLASLPRLESLYVFGTPSTEVLKSIPHEPTFPVLERITLELNSSRRDLPTLFSLLKSSPLKEVTVKEGVKIRRIGASGQVSFAILTAELHRTINTLIFTGFHPADSTSISYIGAFSCLKTLECKTRCLGLGQCFFPLTDSDIEQLASGLPQLVALTLGHNCNFSHPSTTIKSLISLSTHCLSLDRLRFSCDLTNISKDAEAGSGETDPRLMIQSSCKLRDLAFHWMIGPTNAEASGIMKSAFRHLFPQLRFT